MARLDIFGAGDLDDNASIMLEYEGGAKGMYWSSQIAVGHDNGFRVRIYGTKGAIEWARKTRITEGVLYRQADRDLVPRKGYLSRRPVLFPHSSGHPEGYFEAFANIYSTFISALGKKEERQKFPGGPDFRAAEGMQG